MKNKKLVPTSESIGALEGAPCTLYTGKDVPMETTFGEAPKECLVVNYRSAGEFWNLAGKAEGGAARSRGQGEKGWFGSGSWEEGERFAQEGWPEGTAKAKKIMASLNVSVGTADLIERYRYEVEGEAFDIAAVVEGRPESWFQAYREDEIDNSHKGKIVRLIVENSVSCCIGADEIMRKGAAVLAVASFLLDAGHSVEIFAVSSFAGCQGKSISHVVPVKKVDEHVNIDRLAYQIGNPSFFRRHVFSAQENLKGDWRSDLGVGSNYGRCGHWNEEKAQAAGLMDQGDVYIGSSVNKAFKTEVDAIEWVKKSLVKFGINMDKK